MDERKFRFLVVENEYLIGIDAGQLLKEAFDCEVALATVAELAQVVGSSFWDVVVLDAAGTDADAAHAELALSRASALVFLSAYNHLARGVPGLDQWPVVMKPFSLETLVEAVRTALGRVRKP